MFVIVEFLFPSLVGVRSTALVTYIKDVSTLVYTLGLYGATVLTFVDVRLLWDSGRHNSYAMVLCIDEA